MPTRPVLVLCEGSHDIAFLTRLLAVTAGAVPQNVAVSKLEWPFGKLFTDRFASRNANDAKLGSSGPVLPDEPPLLDAVWKLPDDSRHWYFLNCCGDTRADQINAFLKLVIALTQMPEPDRRLAEVGIVFVNDADEIGIVARQKCITDNHAALLAPLLPNFATLVANEVQHSGGYGAGTCVFFKPGTNNGTLEEIVWPMMQAANASRHDSSLALMSQFAVNGTKIGPGKPASRKLKAALTAAGQPECPGSSLAVILRESPHLTADAMRVDVSSMCFVKVLMEV